MSIETSTLKTEEGSSYVQTLNVEEKRAGQTASWTQNGEPLPFAAYISRETLQTLTPRFEEQSKKPEALIAMIRSAPELPLYETGGYMVYLEDSKSGPAKRSSVITKTDRPKPSP